MNIQKVIGAVEEQRGVNSGRIRVISFKKNGIEISNPNEIKSHFPPDGYVFGNSLFNRDECEVKLHSIVEFSAKENEKFNPGLDETIIDFDKEIKTIGYPVFNINSKILIGDASIDQPILKNFVDTDSSSFYILNDGFVYGPFKSNAGEIIPKKGKEVNRWNFNTIQIYKSGDRWYLFKAPVGNDDIIDCMTPTQLVDYLKNQINNQSLNTAFTSLKSALEIQKVKGLDKARIDRALEHLSTFSLNYSQLKILTESSEKFSSAFNTALNQLRGEIVSEFENNWIKGLEKQKQNLEAIVFELQQSNARNENEKNVLFTTISHAKTEYDLILKDKERLIRDIKVHLSILDPNDRKASGLITYEEQVYTNDLIPFDNLNEFIGTFNSTVVNSDQSKYGKTVISQFKDRKCFLSDNVEAIIKIGSLSNNCKTLLQQVEPDWLKFENFYENGLKQIWSSAHEHKEMFHFLILQDLNLASIECYGRPILDLIAKVRSKLPGQGSPFPRNLWIFGIPIDAGISEEAFGLPLIKNTYKEWGYFPKGAALQFNNNTSGKVLKVESIFQHNDIISISPDDYFK